MSWWFNFYRSSDDHVDYREYDDQGIKEVEWVSRIFSESKANQFDEHLDDEAPGEHFIESVWYLGDLSVLRVLIHS